MAPPSALPPLDPLPPDPVESDPAPAASDSAGIARLVTLAHVWHVVSLHHPAVATQGAPWDSAMIIAALRVRSANTDSLLADVYRRMLLVLRDPATRVEWASQRADVGVTTERTDDSVLVVRLAPTAPLGVADSTLLAQTFSAQTFSAQAMSSTGVRRVLFDMRGTTPNSPSEFARRLDRTLRETGVLNALVRGRISTPTERTRRIGVFAPGLAGTTFADAWQESDAQTVAGNAASSLRIAVLADSGTVLPLSLLALLDAGQASLVADGQLINASPLSRVRIPVSASLSVVVRVGELIHADGTVGVFADSTMPSSTVARQATLSMLTSSVSMPLADRPLPVIRSMAQTPIFYDTASYPYLGARILGGARLWSAMRARHAHRDLYDDDIEAVFERVIPRLEAARNPDDYARALSDLAASTDDAEGTLRGASYESAIGNAAFPFRVRSAEGRVFITDVLRDSVTTRLALTPGTELTAVDGFPLSAWLSDHRRQAPAANDWSRLRHQMQQMVRGAAGEATVRVRDANNRERSLSVPRRESYRAAFAATERPATSAVRALSEGVMYVDAEHLSASTVTQTFASAKGARALVLDLRGVLAVDDRLLLAHLATRVNGAEGAMVIGRAIQRSLTAPCLEPIREAALRCADVREAHPWTRNIDTINVFNGRLIALIDERTQGAMERFAVALEQTSGVTFVGSATAGSVSETVPLSLPGGLTVGIAVTELRRADGGQLQRVGLSPAIEVRPTARGLRAGDDEVLARAQQWITQQIEPPRRRR